jgi:hypothetical protein
MIRRGRRPPRFSRIPPRKERPVDPRGDWRFTWRGRDHALPGRWLNDPTSPDGMRWIAAPSAIPTIVGIVAEEAGNQCELKLPKVQCWGWTPRDCGHRHHLVLKKMGGAFADERIWINGERKQIWTCPTCHRARHGRLHWSAKSA